MDPLSEVLSMLKPRSYITAGFDAGGADGSRITVNIPSAGRIPGDSMI